MNFDDFEITSIGARCFNQWFLCRKCGLRYFSSPLDNIDNKGINGLSNVLSMIRKGFSQIREENLEKSIRRNMVNLDTGNIMDYHGYAYVGDELDGKVYLPHFFDAREGNMFLNDEDGWTRWKHKADLFMASLADGKRNLILSNSRAYHDDQETRTSIACQTKELAGYLASEYGRTPENTLVISFIICDCHDAIVELEEPMARQVSVPLLKDDFDAPTDIRLNWTDRYYVNEFRKAIEI